MTAFGPGVGLFKLGLETAEAGVVQFLLCGEYPGGPGPLAEELLIVEDGVEVGQ